MTTDLNALRAENHALRAKQAELREVIRNLERGTAYRRKIAIAMARQKIGQCESCERDGIALVVAHHRRARREHRWCDIHLMEWAMHRAKLEAKESV